MITFLSQSSPHSSRDAMGRTALFTVTTREVRVAVVCDVCVRGTLTTTRIHYNPVLGTAGRGGAARAGGRRAREGQVRVHPVAPGGSNGQGESCPYARNRESPPLRHHWPIIPRLGRTLRNTLDKRDQNNNTASCVQAAVVEALGAACPDLCAVRNLAGSLPAHAAGACACSCQ